MKKLLFGSYSFKVSYKKKIFFFKVVPNDGNSSLSEVKSGGPKSIKEETRQILFNWIRVVLLYSNGQP